MLFLFCDLSLLERLKTTIERIRLTEHTYVEIGS